MGFQSAINRSIGTISAGLGIGSQIDKLNLKARSEAAMDRMRELQIARLSQRIDVDKARGESEALIRNQELLKRQEALKQERAKTRLARAKARSEIKRIKEGEEGGK